MSENDKAPDGPLNAEQARDQVLHEYGLVETPSAEPERLGEVIPPLPQGPPPGTANIRIIPGFYADEFVIPSHGITLSQTEWTNVPQDQVAEITQIAAANQVLLEVDEGS